MALLNIYHAAALLVREMPALPPLVLSLFSMPVTMNARPRKRPRKLPATQQDGGVAATSLLDDAGCAFSGYADDFFGDFGDYPSGYLNEAQATTHTPLAVPDTVGLGYIDYSSFFDPEMLDGSRFENNY